MGLRVFVGREVGAPDYESKAVLFCSSTGLAFGPFFDDAEEAGMFIEWNGYDPRLCGSLGHDAIDSRVWRFRVEREKGWQTKAEIRDKEEAEIIEMEILAEKKAGLL